MLKYGFVFAYAFCVFTIIQNDVLDTTSKSVMLDEAIEKLTVASQALADQTVYTPVFYDANECPINEN